MTAAETNATAGAAPTAGRARPGAWPRRAAGLALAIASGVGLARVFHGATDFPSRDPIRRVDDAVVERLRAEPGLHLALARDFVLAVSLDLEDDAGNRRVFGTDVDLRERRPDRAIHIQRKGARGAIHTDRWNPAAGLTEKLLHGTLDVPAIPLAAALLLGLGLAAWPRRPAPRG